MKIEPVPLFASKKEAAVFASFLLFVLVVTLGVEYRKYREMTRFDDAEINATVLQQYAKETSGRHYQVLKLRLDDGPDVFMTASERLRDLTGYEVRVWLRTGRIGFLDYLKGFFLHGYIEGVSSNKALKYRLADRIRNAHANPEAGELFAALFIATPISKTVRRKLSVLGISHLLAISGFHIALLSLILFWVMYYPYIFLQSRWFPWRNRKRDLFLLTSALLFGYALVLDFPPSVLRAFAMMLTGFFLYDRGIKVVSFSSLLIVVLLLSALWPRLVFRLGFWLSVGGVFYIFLFLQTFAGRSRFFRFVGMHVWVYLMLLPWMLVIFGTFSSWHPLSVVWTMGFVLFYPLALMLHLFGTGGVLDPLIQRLLAVTSEPAVLEIGSGWLLLWVLLGAYAAKSELVKRLLFYLSLAVFVGAVYQIA